MGVDTLISTVTVIVRARSPVRRRADFRGADAGGHRALIAAAKAAGAGRLVYVSAARARLEPISSKPRQGQGRDGGPADRFVAARGHRRAGPVPGDLALPLAQFDWPARKVVISGRGETPTRHVATDDAAETVVGLTLADDPPKVLEFGRADLLTQRSSIARVAARCAGAARRSVCCARP